MTRKEQAEFSRKIVEKIATALRDTFEDDIFFTNDFQTLTFDCGEIEGETRYGSVKFTLHKAGWDLDDAIEEFEERLEKEEKEKENKTSK